MAKLKINVGNCDIHYLICCNGKNVFSGEKSCEHTLLDYGKAQVTISTENRQYDEKVILKILKIPILILFFPIILLLMQVLPLPRVENYFLIKKTFNIYINKNDTLLFFFDSKSHLNEKFIDVELSINSIKYDGIIEFNKNLDEIKQVKKEINTLTLICFVPGLTIGIIMLICGIVCLASEIIILAVITLLLLTIFYVIWLLKIKKSS